MTDSFDAIIKQATTYLTQEFKFISCADKLDKIDIYKIARQDVLDNALRKCANYAYLKHPDKSKRSVFLCYAWADPEHQSYPEQLAHEAAVVQLAKDLETAGFNVLLDRWYDVKGKNINDFIEKIFHGHVVVVGTHLFLEKYKRLSKPGKPDPVLQFEAHFISHLLRHTKETRDKVIPLLLEGTVEESLPIIFHPQTPVDFVKNDRDSELFKLISAIYNFPVRDEGFVKIVEHFQRVKKEIATRGPKDLLKNYGSSMHTLFQQQARAQQEAKATISSVIPSVRSKL